MVEAAMKTAPYVPSVTSVTKRDKRDKLKLDNRRDSVTTPPVGGLSCNACPGAGKKAIEDLARLKAEVLTFCNGYISRGYHAEGVALAKLRRLAER